MKIKDLSHLESANTENINGGAFSFATASTFTTKGFAATKVSTNAATFPGGRSTSSRGFALSVSFGGSASASSSSVSAA